MNNDRYAVSAPRYLLLKLSDSAWPIERVMETMRSYGQVDEVSIDSDPRYTVTDTGRSMLEGGK